MTITLLVADWQLTVHKFFCSVVRQTFITIDNRTMFAVPVTSLT